MNIKFKNCSEEFIYFLLVNGITASETTQDWISSVFIFLIVTLLVGYLNSAHIN